MPLTKMRILIASILLATGLFVSGCTTPSTCDARGPSEVCELHHEYMQTELYTNPKHATMPTDEYLQARTKLFVHSYPFILPNQCDKCVIYVCDECVRVEGEWKRQHGYGKTSH
jgi:hypothetical protein